MKRISILIIALIATISGYTQPSQLINFKQIRGLQAALNAKENAFTKNTAFNRNFGTAANTVAQGNDSRILNGQTAFTWGNHAGLYRSINWMPSFDQTLQQSSALTANRTISGNYDFTINANNFSTNNSEVRLKSTDGTFINSSKDVVLQANGYIRVAAGSAASEDVFLTTNNISVERIQHFADRAGTFAMSVNGELADNTGNINIDVGGWSDDLGYGYEGNTNTDNGLDTKGGYATRSQELSPGNNTTNQNVEYLVYKEVTSTSANLLLPDPGQYKFRVITITNLSSSAEINFQSPWFPAWKMTGGISTPFNTLKARESTPRNGADISWIEIFSDGTDWIIVKYG